MSLKSDNQKFSTSQNLLSQSFLSQNQFTFLPQALRFSPQINLTETGSPGRFVNFFMRGAGSSQTAVLLNGIPINNPVSGKMDPAYFMIDDIDSIEILPGSNSILYGAEAMGGVINIKPREGKGNLTQRAKAAIGNFKTYRINADTSGELNNICFNTTASFYQSGAGNFYNKQHHTTQSDFYRNGTLSNTLNFAMSPFWEISTLIRYTKSKLKYDDLKYFSDTKIYLPVMENFYSKNQDTAAQIMNRWETIPSIWDQTLSLSFFQATRHISSSYSPQKIYGNHLQINYFSTLTLNDKNTSTLGAVWTQESTHEKNKFNHRRPHRAFFAQHSFKEIKNLNIQPGIRIDTYQGLKSRGTYRLGLQYTLNNTLFHSSFGTGFKAPDLLDLYTNTHRAVGNSDLKPETSRSFDLGFDQLWFDQKLKLSMTYFLLYIDHLIQSRLNTMGKYQRINQGTRRSQGIETVLNFSPSSSLEILLSLTYTDAKDLQNHRKTNLIPSLKMTHALTYKPFKKIHFTFSSYTVSQRKDTFTSNKLSGYTSLSAGISYQLTSSVQLYGNLENITDKRYEEVYGYGNRGRTFLFGLAAQY